MKFIRVVFILILLTFNSNAGNKVDGGSKSIADSSGKPLLEIAICLDLSGSTNGLINDVRDNLWILVNQISQLEPLPRLRLAAVGFSRPSFGKGNGYVKVLCDLTTDFDLLAAELYKLKPSIEKGDQLVGAAISTCVSQLKWSEDKQAVKIIFLAGNGMVNAAGNDYIRECERASQKGIIINTLYIPREKNLIKELPGWRRIASLTGGMQGEITVNKQDQFSTWDSLDKKKFSEFNKNLNAHYLWAGSDSSSCRKNQFTADSGSWFASGESFLHRLYYKTTREYESSISARSCEITLRPVANNENIQDPGKLPDEFSKKLITVRDNRRKYAESVHEKFPAGAHKKYAMMFNDGTWKDTGVFHQSVLSMLFRQWSLLVKQ